MNNEQFLELLQFEVKEYNKIIATEKGDWIVKGFIDIYQNIYTISVDTKVVSKVIELLLIPAFEQFALKYDMTLELPKHQNFYPDLTFISNTTGARFAVDIKSTYKSDRNKIGSMTLGAFTGYFRNRLSTKMTMYPYGSYAGHFVLGVVYSKSEIENNEKLKYTLAELDKIESVIRDFIFFAQPKYKIAATTPGSGNTKNIGSVSNLQKLLEGNGPFAELGEEVYDDYWMYYMTTDMAKALEIPRPYGNLKTYLEFKEKNIDVLEKNKEKILSLDEHIENEEGNEEGSEVE